MFTRSVWDGITIYTSYQSGEHLVNRERIVMVQEFGQDGHRLPYWKAAYIKDDDVALKLSFRTIDKQEIDRGFGVKTDRLVMKCTWEVARDNSVGQMQDDYANAAAGQIIAWSTKKELLFQTWRYENFWGFKAPVKNSEGSYCFEHALPHDLIINGEGHVAEGHLVRTMKHNSIDSNGQQVREFLKSSSLEKQGSLGIESDEPIQDFV